MTLILANNINISTSLGISGSLVVSGSATTTSTSSTTSSTIPTSNGSTGTAVVPSNSTCLSHKVNKSTGQCVPVVQLINTTSLCPINKINISNATNITTKCINSLKSILLHSQIKPFSTLQSYTNIQLFCPITQIAIYPMPTITECINLAIISFLNIIYPLSALVFTPIQLIFGIMLIISILVYTYVEPKDHKLSVTFIYTLFILSIFGTGIAFFI